MKLDDYEVARRILRSHPNQILGQIDYLITANNVDFCIEAVKKLGLDFFKETKITNHIEDVGLDAIIRTIRVNKAWVK